MGRTNRPAWDADTSDERRWLSQLGHLLGALPPGQRRVAECLISDTKMTYPGLAAALGVHRGTVSQHLRHIRMRHPKIYSAIMTERRRKLDIRHDQAVKRAAAHDAKWFQFLWTGRDYKSGRR